MYIFTPTHICIYLHYIYVYIHIYTCIYIYMCVYVTYILYIILHICVFTYYTCVCPLSLEFPPGRCAGARLASSAIQQLPPAVYSIHGNVYMSKLLSQLSPTLSFPAVSTSLSSSVSLFLPADRFISTILDTPVKTQFCAHKKKDKNSNILNGKWIWENEKDIPIQ